MGNYEQVKNARARLKQRLVYIMGNQCCLCGYDKCITALEFHHKDPTQKEFTIGDNTNVGFEKACEEAKKCILVCANCHREIHTLNLDVSNIECFDENEYQQFHQEIQDLKTHKLTYCKNCGQIITNGAIYCKSCFTLSRRKTERPDRETLKQLIREKSFLGIAEIYEVTDNAIRKWCKTMNLPSTKKEINSYSDEEWNEV